jgi:hypothetical protein
MKRPEAERLYGPDWLGLRMAGPADFANFVEGCVTPCMRTAIGNVLWNEHRLRRSKSRETRRGGDDNRATA